MRIAVYHNLLSGGAKRALAELARRLAERHEIDVFSLSCSNHDFADLRPFVWEYRTFRFDPLPLLASPLGRLNQAARTADLLRLNRLSRQIAQEIEQVDTTSSSCPSVPVRDQPEYPGARSAPSVYFCQEPVAAAA